MRDIDFKAYKTMFVRHYTGPFAINRGYGWRTIYHNLYDELIIQHLKKNISLANTAPYYPRYYFIDNDFSLNDAKNSGERIDEILRAFNLNENQYYLMTSPSFFENFANCHIVFQLKYKNEFPTLKLGLDFIQNTLQKLIKHDAFEKPIEIYPQLNKPFRLPLGIGQYLLAHDSFRPLTNLSWERAMHFIEKIDAVNIAPRQLNIPFGAESKNKIKHEINIFKFSDDENSQLLPEGQKLYEEGLKEHNSRNMSQWKVIMYLLNRGLDTEEVAEKTLTWIKNKHNSFSNEATEGNWGKIQDEIKRQIKSSTKFREKFESNKFSIAYSDLLLAKHYFPDTINQKRLVIFFSYCRPRLHHDWIYFSQEIACSFMGKNYYKEFLRELETKQIIQVNWDYRHNLGDRSDSYSRQIKLKINLSENEIPLITQKEPINFYDAWLLASKGNVKLASKLSELKTQRFYANRK